MIGYSLIALNDMISELGESTVKTYSPRFRLLLILMLKALSGIKPLSLRNELSLPRP